MAEEWAKEQEDRWKQSDRPLKLSRSEGGMDFDRLERVKSHLHEKLEEHTLMHLKEEFDAAQENSRQLYVSANESLLYLKRGLHTLEDRLVKEGNEVERRREIIMKLDPSYTKFGPR